MRSTVENRSSFFLLLIVSGPLLVATGCSSGQPSSTGATGLLPGDGGRTAGPTCDADAACLAATGGAGGGGGARGAGGGTGRDAGDCVPSPEICDGKDNDCDGVVDNGFTYQGTPVGGPCYSSGFGACIAMSRVTCISTSMAGCPATPMPADDSYHTTAAPNGSWDWNCNNNVDRKYPLATCESFTAATCPSQGWNTEPGQSGDCGQSLIQQSCTAAAGGCQSTGQPVTVSEGCK